jgi:hypothetical protein
MTNHFTTEHTSMQIIHATNSARELNETYSTCLQCESERTLWRVCVVECSISEN